EGPALEIPSAIGLLQRELPADHPARQHRRSEPRAFLVRPADDLEGTARPDARVGERSDRLEGGEDPQGAVEPAPGRHRVEVGPAHHRRRLLVLARDPPVDVAEVVDADRTPGVPQPAGEQVPGIAVLIAQREPPHPPCGSAPHRGHRDHRVPKPLAVDQGSFGHLNPPPPWFAGIPGRPWTEGPWSVRHAPRTPPLGEGGGKAPDQRRRIVASAQDTGWRYP